MVQVLRGSKQVGDCTAKAWKDFLCAQNVAAPQDGGVSIDTVDGDALALRADKPYLLCARIEVFSQLAEYFATSFRG